MRKYPRREKQVSISQKVKKKFAYSPSIQAKKCYSKLPTRFSYSMHNAKNIHQINQINCQYSSVKEKNLSTNQCNDTSSWIAKLVNGIQDQDQQNKNLQKLSQIQNRSNSDLPEDSKQYADNQFLFLQSQNLFDDKFDILKHKNNAQYSKQKDVAKAYNKKPTICQKQTHDKKFQKTKKMIQQPLKQNNKKVNTSLNNNKKSIRQALIEIQLNELNQKNKQNNEGLRGPPVTRVNSNTKRQSNKISKRNSVAKLSPRKQYNVQKFSNSNIQHQISQKQESKTIKNNVKNQEKPQKRVNDNKSTSTQVPKSKSLTKVPQTVGSSAKNNAIQNKISVQNSMSKNQTLNSGTKKYSINKLKMQTQQHQTRKNSFILPQQLKQCKQQCRIIKQHSENIQMKSLFNQENQEISLKISSNTQLLYSSQKSKRVGGIKKNKHRNSDVQSHKFSLQGQSIKMQEKNVNKTDNHESEKMNMDHNKVQEQKTKQRQECKKDLKRNTFNKQTRIQQQKIVQNIKSKYNYLVNDNKDLVKDRNLVQVRAESTDKQRKDRRILIHLEEEDFPTSFRKKSSLPTNYNFQAIKANEVKIYTQNRYLLENKETQKIQNDGKNSTKQINQYQFKSIQNPKKSQLERFNKEMVYKLFNKIKLDPLKQIVNKNNIKLRGLSQEQKNQLGSIISKIHYQDQQYDFDSFYSQFTKSNLQCTSSGCFSKQKKTKNHSNQKYQQLNQRKQFSNQKRKVSDQRNQEQQEQAYSFILDKSVDHQTQPINQQRFAQQCGQNNINAQNHITLGHRRRNSKIIKKKLFDEIKRISYLQRQAIDQLQKNSRIEEKQITSTSHNQDNYREMSVKHNIKQMSQANKRNNVRQLQSKQNTASIHIKPKYSYQRRLQIEQQLNQNICKDPYIQAPSLTQIQIHTRRDIFQIKNYQQERKAIKPNLQNLNRSLQSFQRNYPQRGIIKQQTFDSEQLIQQNKTIQNNKKRIVLSHSQNKQQGSLIQKLNQKLTTYIDKNQLQSTYRQFDLNFSLLKKHIR